MSKPRMGSILTAGHRQKGDCNRFRVLGCGLRIRVQGFSNTRRYTPKPTNQTPNLMGLGFRALGLWGLGLRAWGIIPVLNRACLAEGR